MTKPLLDIYADLHNIAEPAWKENKTAAYIANYLKALPGFEVQSGVAGGTGVVAVLKGKMPGDKVGFRADIDALLFNKDGKTTAVHACGHDSHVAMLLAFADQVSKTGINRGELKLIFQPAEEVDTGSRAVIKDKVVDNLDWLFAMHLRPFQELNSNECCPLLQHGSNYCIQAVIHGKGAHAGRPHLAVNTAEIAVQIINAVNSLREDPSIQHSAKITKIMAGGKSLNTIPDCCEIAFDLRAQTNEIMRSLISKISSIIESVPKLYGGSAEITQVEGVPAAEIDEDAIKVAKNALVKVVGAENIVDKLVSPGADDFHFYKLHKPTLKAAYMGIGCGLTPGLHDPEMHFDQEALFKGPKIYQEIVNQILM